MTYLHQLPKHKAQLGKTSWEEGLHTWDWGLMIIALEALSLVEKVEPVQVHFVLRLRDQRSKWMQDGCKVYMDSYMTSNGSCFMMTWIIFKNRLLELGQTQNQETMALMNLITIDLLIFIMCKDPAWLEIHWNSIWLRAWSYTTSHYTRRPVVTLHWFWKYLGTAFGHSLWALTISWSRLLARAWSGAREKWRRPGRQHGLWHGIRSFLSSSRLWPRRLRPVLADRFANE